MGYYDDVLEHHGILGQKWGVRRFENKNGTLTPAGKNRYNSVDGKYQKLKKKATPNKVETTGGNRKKDTTEPEKKKGLTDKQKKMIIAGAAVVGTALTAYGGYKLYQKKQTQTSDKAVSNAKSALNEFKTLQSNPNKPTFSKPDQNTSQSLAKNLTPPGAKTVNSGKSSHQTVKAPASVNNQKSSLQFQTNPRGYLDKERTSTSSKPLNDALGSVKGAKSFMNASKANDDLVNDLLKKNASMLIGF